MSEEEYTEMRDLYMGYCLNCQNWTREQCEPDAEYYECPECGKKQVFGAEEALLMGAFELE